MRIKKKTLMYFLLVPWTVVCVSAGYVIIGMIIETLSS